MRRRCRDRITSYNVCYTKLLRIVARTHIGQGAPNKVDSHDAHGAPLGSEELALTKRGFGRDPEASFVIPAEVAEHMGGCIARGAELEATWQGLLETKKSEPAVAAWLARITSYNVCYTKLLR